MERTRRLYWHGVLSQEVVDAAQAITGWPSEDSQARFVAEVVDDPFVLGHPPRAGYRYGVLKRLVAVVEKAGAAVSDSLISAMLEAQPTTAAQSQQDDQWTPFYRCFELKGGPAALRVYPEFSQVGLALWPAGYALAEWLMTRPEDFRGANIVELGSGVGLTAVAAARYTEARSVTLTDYLPSVNSNAEENMFLCGLSAEESARPRVRVRELDWEKAMSGDADTLELVKESAATHLLAADVVYDPEVIPALAHTVSAFVSLCPGLQGAIFGVTHRTEQSWQLAVDELARRGLSLKAAASAESLQSEEERIFQYDRSLVKIYILEKK
eukprot:Hpha_TRINITY_DN16916_c1_g6::TRINITY_DN16916_c1_g6_i1::g.54945::m.54945